MNKEKSPSDTELKSAASRFPGEPGVYLMRDDKNAVIYVGKAKNLKNRVRSYFSGSKDIKTSHLVKKIKNLEYIVTGTEYEALLLENTLIKRHTPRYNINLKDGKSYPVIRITSEEYPRIFRTRRIVRDGSEYFGPFPAVQHIDTYLDLIEKLFPLRKCRGKLKVRKQPCLYFHIGRCSAPCAGKITRDEYLQQVAGIRSLLSGKTGDLRKDLEERMQKASADLKYEKAAAFRDSLRAIADLESSQKVVDFDEESRDYVDYAEEGTFCTIIVFQMRGGRLHGREVYRTHLYAPGSEVLEQFLLQFYSDPEKIPGKIYVSRLEEASTLSLYFLRELNTVVEVLPVREKRDVAVLRLVHDNAEHDLRRRLQDAGNLPALEDLRDILHLPKTPLRIEGIDIAQLDGKHPVASLVSFFRGAPEKKSYRKFHIKSLNGLIDDFEAVREVVARRYTKVLNEEGERPDLILIDGGKGQVSAAKGILDALGLADIPLIGLAKKHEEIFLPSRKDPVIIPEGSPALRILQAVRDEAHRFATGFNKQLRQKTIGLKLLTSVEGIGEEKGKKILKHFVSRDAILSAEGHEIARVAGVGLEAAEALKDFLKERESKSGY